MDIWEETLNWKPSLEQQELFQCLYKLIVEGNRQLNLTRITDPEDFWEKHLWDSLRGIKFLISAEGIETKKIKIIDLGTGAGFPGIPVAIIIKNCTVNLVDSTKKKINFIDSILPALDLKNVKATTCRAEEIGRDSQHRETYDMALIRAVASVSACAEYTLPLLKQGGLAVIYRGNLTDEEISQIENAVEQLGGVIESIEQFNTPISNSDRHCLYVRKVASTPAKFPRGIGVPVQRPL
ncbi:16S rRNA (guanine(527)-N(7))-methyltransferase RsmG [Plectonema cf. radiosum LEGE 06105]|uniref:Ribosomal RNA small subunit methyltransferase G n=2 Tax=Plectonema TaxID=1183 RepID=A0A8J7F3Y3_9CYAN|nr:16S rRNA (guanine(527)-N(7))-methyltransferase RsmG [Plectonema radiosum]MBE9215886.1 16S rRNA (guanine(527)-N(7))-methyltransferase RsmG [Plectonema cf. radiosum LEGE 06105]